MRILVTEDDRAVSRFLQKGLEAENYAVDVSSDGEEAAHAAQEYDYDLMILDLNIPKMDGLAVLRKVRSRKESLPILILSSRGKVEERANGLDLGADDYLVKPFSYQELSARVRALLRRGRRPPEATLHYADLEMHRVERIVRRGNKAIELTSKEFALLEYLLRNAGRPVSRNLIIEHVWNLSFDTMTNVVDVYINYLRKKIDEGFETKLIQTVRGVGYRLGGDSAE
jgi:two-component system copper resistance phosphate regulon response regulator CusR